MIKVAPASTGFGVIVIALNIGAAVSRVTVLVTVVALPELSVDTIVMTLLPSTKDLVVLKLPSEATVTAVPFTVRVTGFEVTSEVVPLIVTVDWFVIKSSAGDKMVNTGGTVSIVIATLTAVAEFPSLFSALIVIV